jgi:hypothetical protein
MSKKYTGIVKKSPLEGGVWMLDASDSFMYQLIGADVSLLKDGASVEVEGEVDQNMMSLAMTGPILKVKKLTKK